jgi:hypothetical protein
MLGWGTLHFDGGFLIYKIMKEEITGFIFYRSFYEAIKKLENVEDRCVIYQAICEYSFYGTDPILDGLKSIIWTLIKPQIDANIKKRIDAKKGGAPKGNNNAKKQPKTTIVDLENNLWLNKKQPKENDNDNINEKENNNINEKEKEIELDFGKYNNI